MRARIWLPLCCVLLIAACAESPPRPEPGSAGGVRAAPDDATAAAITRHRQQAQRKAAAGDHAGAAREWQIVLLLAPGDEASRRALDAERGAIRDGVRINLQAGQAALRTGDAERASQALLKVLALDPDNADAAKSLREIDRQRVARIQAAQSQRAARDTQAGVAVPARPAPAPGIVSDAVDNYDLEQPIEMFRAGDIDGGLREFRAFVDANPRNDPARLRIATLVYERGVEEEQKGARDQALMLIEQAIALRGKAVPEWTARAQALRKAQNAPKRTDRDPRIS
jgi:tetratricopeptide (TPR) repeat protein